MAVHGSLLRLVTVPVIVSGSSSSLSVDGVIEERWTSSGSSVAFAGTEARWPGRSAAAVLDVLTKLPSSASSTASATRWGVRPGHRRGDCRLPFLRARREGDGCCTARL